MFRGFGKFIVVAVVAAAVGAAIGVGLASLTSPDDTPTAAAPTATTPVATPPPVVAPPATTQPVAPPPAQTQTDTQTQTATTPATFTGPVPKVEITSATIGSPAADGTAVASARVSVTNRYAAPLPLASPTLVSGSDDVALDAAAQTAAGALVGTLAPGATASGELTFTLPVAVTKRLRAAPTARLQIARRTVMLKLTVAG